MSEQQQVEDLKSKLENTNDKDVGEGVITGQGLSPEDDKRILRKIDMW